MVRGITSDEAGTEHRGAGSADPLGLPVTRIATEGIVRCFAEDALLDAAELMASERVHAIGVSGDDPEDGVAVLSDRDLIEAIATGAGLAEQAAGRVAATEALTIPSGATVGEAARLMHEHQVGHLIVVDERSGSPRGVVSTLDVLRSVSGKRGDVGLSSPLLLLAHDGGPSGADGAALARLLAGPRGRVEAALVVPFSGESPGERPAATWAELCEARRRRGEELLDSQVLPELPAGSVGRVTLDDSPPPTLARLTSSIRPDLVVFGSSDRGVLGRVVLGGTAERFARISDAPIAVAPRGFRDHAPHAISRILVGFDGRDDSRRALALAVQLARVHGAAVRLACVVEPRSTVSADVAAEALNALSGAGIGDRRAQRLTERARDDAWELAGGQVETELALAYGDPAAHLVKEAEADDLLILGSRRASPVSRALLGSVSGRVLRDAEVPVILAGRGEWPGG